MRTGGLNWIAIIVAAAMIYVIGFVTYGLLVPAETWMAWSGLSQAQLDAADRMAFGPVMPLMTATFLALLFKWGQVRTATKGAQWAIVVALASAIPVCLYGWVYGVVPIQLTLVDSAHLLVGHVVAGAIIGVWK